MKTLTDLFEHFVRDIYYAEKEIGKLMSDIVAKTEDADLKAAFETMASENQTQTTRLEDAMRALGWSVGGVTCEAIDGIIKETRHIMSDANDPDARDAAMIAAAQAVLHYEITRFGTIASWAKTLGHNQVETLVRQNLDEVYETDRRLTDLAEPLLNRQAISA